MCTFYLNGQKIGLREEFQSFILACSQFFLYTCFITFSIVYSFFTYVSLFLFFLSSVSVSVCLSVFLSLTLTVCLSVYGTYIRW